MLNNGRLTLTYNPVMIILHDRLSLCRPLTYQLRRPGDDSSVYIVQWSKGLTQDGGTTFSDLLCKLWLSGFVGSVGQWMQSVISTLRCTCNLERIC
jgi:hypothetical protein